MGALRRAIRNLSHSFEVDREKRKAHVEANADKADRVLTGFGIAIGASLLVLLGIHLFERRDDSE